MAAPRGVQKYVRGWIWLIALLAMTSTGLTIRYWASSRPWWFLALLAPCSLAVTFGFYLVTPRLVLDLPFAWRDLLPGALICTAIAAVINLSSTFFLARWFGVYGRAYGAFGISIALMSWIGIISLFWVWIAAARSRLLGTPSRQCSRDGDGADLRGACRGAARPTRADGVTESA